ncbi:MAG: DNA polymerase I [Bacilli bacterium]
MKKVILVDGNNLMFRSYYATAYSGSIMKNSKGMPTNALYGFVSMMNKIILEENPSYIAVAFDVGTNFRKQKYPTYKAGRSETPDELLRQMPIAREILDAMGIKHFELEPYEADDIIGTFAKLAELDPEFDATIVSSDKDLLQLISDQVEVKLLKQKGHIRYNPKTFKEDWGINPIEVIDYKALAGDMSDNIPGVKGIGDKTALTLLKQYGTIENIYNNIDSIKGKLQEKLINDKESAFISKEIATIYKDVPLNIDLEDVKYEGPNNRLVEIYKELEFYSLVKKLELDEESIPYDNRELEFKHLSDVSELKLEDELAFYIECNKFNYHEAEIVGMSIATKENNYFIDKDLIKDVIPFLKDKIIYTFDYKKAWVLLKNMGLSIEKINFDLMIAAYLLDYNVKDDIAYLMNQDEIPVDFYEQSLKKGFNEKDIVWKSKYILDNQSRFVNELKKEDMYELYTEIEHPLIEVLASMEYEGIICDKSILDEMQKEILNKILVVTKEIYELAGEEFNVSSPVQIGKILFDKLGLPHGKMYARGYKTDVKTLHKLKGMHPIIEKILEYRNLTKMNSTYLEGLSNYIHSDGKIHTIYKQNFTRTGRLSSVEPNLQNIPARDEEGRKIRKAFFPSNDLLYSADYSQIELRILAHISGSKELQDAFINGIDIHTKVAADIYNKDISEVTKFERSTAKAVIFGIVYGISSFGLGENLDISAKEASAFINKYYELYPGVKNYMDNIKKEAYDCGYVRTLFKRKRVIPELANKNYMIRLSGERIALNTPIQGTSADIIKKAMVTIYHKFKEQNIKSKMLLQVHDELIIDVVKEEKDIVQSIVKDAMENAIKLDVPIIVSADYGTDWYETK